MISLEIRKALITVVAALGLTAPAWAEPGDADGDGMPNEYEAAHGLNPLLDDAGDDPDGDGFSNIQEYWMVTDPADYGSRPTLADRQEVLSGYWPLVSNTVRLLGNAPAGQLTNGACFADSALSLSGSAFVDFGAAPGIESPAAFSWGLWIQPAVSNVEQRLLGRFRADGNQRSHAAFLDPAMHLWLFVSDDGSADEGHALARVSDEPVAEPGEWIHLAAVWNGTTATAPLTAYVNGSPVIMTTAMTAPITLVHTGSVDFTLGAFDLDPADPASVSNTFQGAMNGLVFAAAPFDPVEVRELYCLGPLCSLAEWIALDSDADGLPDWWERRYFNSLTWNSGDDPDSDGASNGLELQAGTCPSDPADHPIMTLYVNGGWSSVPAGQDPDGAGPATGMFTDAFVTIQAAVNAAVPGARIVLSPGVYKETLAIEKSVTIAGSDPADPTGGTAPTAVIRPLDLSENGACVDVGDTAGRAAVTPTVIFEDITLDGVLLKEYGAYPIRGLQYHAGSGGAVRRCHITWLRPTAIGMQTGWSIFVFDGSVDVDSCLFDQIGKGAICAAAKSKGSTSARYTLSARTPSCSMNRSAALSRATTFTGSVPAAKPTWTTAEPAWPGTAVSATRSV